MQQNLRKLKKPSPPASPVKLSIVAPPPTPPKTAPYTNNPYSLEHFTPPPPEAGPYRLGGCEELIPDAIETDEHKIQQRLKQIGFGKSTKGYETYVTLVAKHVREIDNEDHPVTPRANQKCSKRSWDGQLKKWRRLLHRWDNVLQAEGQSPAFSSEFGGSEEDFSPSNFQGSAHRESLDSCAVSLMDLYNEEPRNRSWGSECSETPRMDDLADFTDGSDSSEWQPSLCHSL